MRAIRSGVVVCLAMLAACVTPRPSPAPEQSPPPPSSASSEASPFRPEARALFAGCVGRASGRGRSYSCGDVEAWILAMAADPELAMRIGTQGLRPMLHGEPDAQKEERVLAGRHWPAARVTTCDDAAPPRCDSGHVVAIAAPQGSGSWFLGCVARDGAADGLARCEKMLESFAQQGTPEGLSLGRPESGQGDAPHLLSRPLALPGGCHVVEATAMTGNLECKDSAFSWIASPTQSSQELEAGFERFLTEFEKGGVLRETQRMPCAIEHTQGRCVLLEGNLKEGKARFYLGIATVGGNTVRVICSMLGPVSPFPPVCNGALALP